MGDTEGMGQEDNRIEIKGKQEIEVLKYND
jgi:hypothetical protein